MSIAVYLPLLVCAGLAGLAAPAARRMAPGPGAWTMAGTALAGALFSAWSLVMLAAMLVDDMPGFGWLEPRVPVPDGVSGVALALLVASGARTARAFGRHRTEARALRGLAATGRDACQDLVIVEADEPDAFAVADGVWKSSGTVYVTSGMLRLLDPAQQRILLAHERAHLSGRHSTARLLAALAAAANPLLAPARDAVAYLCERHADEAAATVTGSRALVARTVATAALAGAGRFPSAGARRFPPAAPALHRLAVADRVTAMMADRPRPRRVVWLLAAAAVALLAVTGLDATFDFASIASIVV